MKIRASSIWIKRLVSWLLVGVLLFFLVGAVAAQPVSAQPTPTNLVATLINDHRVDLTWDPVVGVDGFHIEESTHADFIPSILITVNNPAATSYQDNNVYPGSTFYYRITSFIGAVDSAYSNVASVQIVLNPPGAPAAPSNLAGAFVSGTQIDLTWTDNSSNEVGFLLERATNIGFTTGLMSFNIAPNLTSYSDSNGISGITTYYYRISAYNAIGTSPTSNVAIVPPPVVLAITTTTLPDGTVG